MMKKLDKIGIISDTHGDVSGWQRAIDLWGAVDLIIHAGDVLYHGPRNPLVKGYDPAGLAALINNSCVPVLIARGNCDADVDQLMLDWPLNSPLVFLQTPFLRIMVNHGENLDQQEMVKLSSRYQVGLFIYGHTHVPEVERVNNIVLLNPGSPSLPKGDGTPSVALLSRTVLTLFNLNSGSPVKEVILEE